MSWTTVLVQHLALHEVQPYSESVWQDLASHIQRGRAIGLVPSGLDAYATKAFHAALWRLGLPLVLPTGSGTEDDPTIVPSDGEDEDELAGAVASSWPPAEPGSRAAVTAASTEAESSRAGSARKRRRLGKRRQVVEPPPAEPASVDVTRGRLERMITGIGATLECPLCLQVRENTIVTGCGHSFCVVCAHKCFSTPRKPTCPSCSQPVYHVTRAYALDGAYGVLASIAAEDPSLPVVHLAEERVNVQYDDVLQQLDARVEEYNHATEDDA